MYMHVYMFVHVYSLSAFSCEKLTCKCVKVGRGRNEGRNYEGTNGVAGFLPVAVQQPCSPPDRLVAIIIIILLLLFVTRVVVLLLIVAVFFLFVDVAAAAAAVVGKTSRAAYPPIVILRISERQFVPRGLDETTVH